VLTGVVDLHDVLCHVLATAVRYDEIMTEKVGKQAAFDLQCPREQVSITKIDQASFGASGCGKRASYVGADRRCDPIQDESTLMNQCTVVPGTPVTKL
jgi:hypothetical protein